MASNHFFKPKSNFKLKVKVKHIDRCRPLFMNDEIVGLAIMNDGEEIPAILKRTDGDVEYLTLERQPLNRIVKFFDYDMPAMDEGSMSFEDDETEGEN